MVTRRLLIAVALVACAPSEHRNAREKYNNGVAHLAAGNFEAAEKALLEARSNAGVDPELRFRAAYNLGISYDAHAQKQKTGKDADLAKALELQLQAVTWFSDAVRLKKDDRDARDNLAIVRLRSQALSDELSRGDGKLERRLDAVIDQQRAVLEESRGAWIAIKTTGGADPLAQQETLTRLADRERGVVADVGVLGDVAADEIDAIGKKPDDKRTAEERVRVVQLKNLEQYLQDGRSKIAEARRKLQELSAENGVARVEASLVSLKRAREQLLDPISVLQEIARDQLELRQETDAIARLRSDATKLATGEGSEPPQPQVIPAWLEPAVLGERQGGLRDRVDEVRSRLQATVDSADKPTGSGSNAEPQDLSAEQAKTISDLRLALPLVAEASAAMDRARTALGEQSLEPAMRSESDALIALAKAIELFADLKKSVELAYGTQQRVVALLSPQAATLPAAERASQTKNGLAQNVARMRRIKELLSEEVAKLEQQRGELESKAVSPGSGSAPVQGSGAADPSQLEGAKHELEQRKQQMAAAEGYRSDAEKALGDLGRAIATNKDPLTPAKVAKDKLEQLRKLFFSVVEHLAELIRQQNETKDQTSQANGLDDFAREPKLPALVQRQDEHAKMASAIVDALASQADAGANGNANANAAAEQQAQAKAFAAAAAEVRLARTEMATTQATLGKAADPKKTQSISLTPALDSQGKAIEHLESALRLLQPPSPDTQNKKDPKQEQQQGQQQQEQQPKPDNKQHQQAQGGAGQRARDQDAKRQRDKQKPSGDAVDQDW
jgi:hypothetical protein